MKIKTFYAKSMAEALRRIGEDLGPDALILSTKEIPLKSGLGFGGRTGFEVVAAVDTSEAQDPGTYDLRSLGEHGSRTSTRGNEKRQPLHLDRVKDALNSRASSEKSALGAGRRAGEPYSEMRRLIHSLHRPAPSLNSLFNDVAASELYHEMVANEVSEWLACKLLDEAQRGNTQLKNRESLTQSVMKVAQDLITTEERPNMLPQKKAVIFVGPTGVGKTTVTAKLAARLALELKKKVALVTLDTFRIAGAEQLRTYARLIGLPFRAIPNVSMLPGTLEEFSHRDYILIDTTGRGPRDFGEMRDLMDYLQQSSHIERHLVLSAATKSVDMQEIVDRYKGCNPDRLLFTKLDETTTFGPIFNELVRSRKAPSYFSDGQRVPEDLHLWTKERIVDVLLSGN